MSSGVHLPHLLPLLATLHRLGDYDPSLVAPDLPLLAYLLGILPCGRERALVLGIIKAVVAASPSPASNADLRWCVSPLVTLAGLGGRLTAADADRIGHALRSDGFRVRAPRAACDATRSTAAARAPTPLPRSPR